MKNVLVIFGLAIFCLSNYSQETGTFTDQRDGKVYKTVKIGTQWIMAENLVYKPSKGNYWAFKFENSNIDKYGYLYDWETAKKIVPSGWHLPSKEEWETLFNTLGPDSLAVGNSLKEGGSSGFNALYGGFYIPGTSSYPGAFSYPEGSLACFWTSSKSGSASVWSINYFASNNKVKIAKNFTNSVGMSVRLFRDSTNINPFNTKTTEQNSLNNNEIKVAEINTYSYWPHKRAILLEAEYFVGDNIDKGFKKTIDAENSFLTGLGLTWVTKDGSGNIISSADVNKYDYSGAEMFGGLRCMYYMNDVLALGGRIGIYSYTQKLSVNGTDELGTLFNFVFIGPSITWHFYKIKRVGFLLKGDLSFAAGAQESVPALNLLVSDNSFSDKLPTGMADLIKNTHKTANFTGFQMNFGIGADYFIVKWFNVEAGLQLNTFSGSFDKALWPGTETSISSISPVFSFSLNFLIRNRTEN
jgi:uncharacterized protein (TIGR02145 family)